jgi:hypothetical protein
VGDVSYPRSDDDSAPPPSGAFEVGGTLYLPRIGAGKILAFEGWSFTAVEYTKRAPDAVAALRTEFDSSNGVRASFLKDLAKSFRNELVAAGFTEAQIEMTTRGRCPTGFQVHHVIPLDDGGTNDFSNLILIRNQSEHTAITAYQNKVIRNLAHGESRNVDFPTPPRGTRIHPHPVTSLPIERKLYRRKS